LNAPPGNASAQRLINMARQIPLAGFLICFCAGAALSQSHLQSDTARLCQRVAEIKELPIKGDPGRDAAYDAIVGAGESLLPCLIKQVTNLRRMRDPRCPPLSSQTTVGDVSYFVLVDITKLDFVEMLPPDVQRKYQTEGAYAYETYIRRKGSRRQLQSRLLAWYRKKHLSA
jgi:hypothetical protein